MLEINGQINNANYANQLNTLVSALTANHSYEKAIQIGEKAVHVFSQIDRTALQDLLYRQSISNLSYAYFESGDIKKAISILLPLSSEEVPDDENKLSDIKRLVNYYQRAGLTDLMKEACEDCLKMAEKIGGKNSDLYAGALIFASEVQEKDGDAILMLQEAASIYLEMYGKNNASYIGVQKMLTLRGAEREDLIGSKSILNDYEDLYGNNSRKFFEEYINYLSQTGGQFKELKNIRNLYITTLQLDSLSQSILALFSENDDLYLWSRHNLAEMFIDCYEMTLDTIFYNSGVEIQNNVLSIASSLYGSDNIKYIREIEHLAEIKSSICNLYYFTHWEESSKIRDLYFTKEGDLEGWKFYESTFIAKCYVEIQELQRRAVDYYIQIGDEASYNYAAACKRLADYYFQEIDNFPTTKFLYKSGDVIGNKMEEKRNNAEQLYKEALNIYKSVADFDSASKVQLSLSFLYDNFYDFINSANALTESFKFWKNETLKQMTLMTSKEKSQTVFDGYWQSLTNLYNSEVYYKSKRASCDSIYAKLSYDVQLFTKGLLLNSEINLRNQILSTENASVIDKLNRLAKIKELLSNPSNISNREELHKEYQRLERQLMKESEQYGNYMHSSSYTFTDVRSCLSKNDVAIEFAAVRNPLPDDNNRFYYYALMLKHDYSYPKIIPLDGNISSDSIYKKIWEPLSDEIRGVKNIYFSPIYELNNLPIESAKLPDGSYLSDLGINLYRVSSTREIIQQRKKGAYESAVLYGGLEYNVDIKDLIESDSKERADGLRGLGGLNIDVENDLRQENTTWEYLVGTKIEVSEINKIISNFGIKTKLFSASNGTESTFKNLSGKKVDIIHVATHGFYVKSLENEYEDNCLERSGLALAGANFINSGDSLPEGVDDGILTADEISRIDFRGTDLIVLSACDTGLGDITSEGVYGLQRGFKNAGVKSVLMSLWKVNDTATMMLMREFYNHLFRGCSKIESLKRAQMYVRMHKRYEDPKFWAGFILLDGLD